MNASEPDATSEQVLAISQTFHRLDEAHRRLQGRFARRLALSSTELTALFLISDSPGIGPGALSNDLALSTGAMTALIGRLEDSGHVTRVADTRDRRRLGLQLTAPGRDALQNLSLAYREVLTEAHPDAALTALLPQLERITDTLNAAARHPEPAPTADGSSPFHPGTP